MPILEPLEARARRYRNRAASLRRQAEAGDAGPEWADLLDIANQYDRLAERLVGTDRGPVASGTRSSVEFSREQPAYPARLR
jgi:hypothetical protein